MLSSCTVHCDRLILPLALLSDHVPAVIVWLTTTKHIKLSELITGVTHCQHFGHQLQSDITDCSTPLFLSCRRAYELAFASTYMFAGQRPIFKEVDEVTFMRPVDVGDLLRLRSCILHTKLSSPDNDKVFPSTGL